MDTFDYIIVGAGSAGCVLANRLGQDLQTKILVIEAGGSSDTVIVNMPSALSIPMNTKRFNWGFTTVPEPHLDGRVMNLPRGKGIGGSSSINGMCYVRGNPMDYELWESKGAKGWNWANVLPYFIRAENVIGEGKYRGRKGLLSVTRGPEKNPLYQTFVEAGAQAGYAVSSNMNDVQHEGFGPMEMTVGKGNRCSAAVAYLQPAIKRGNVKVVKHAFAKRIIFDGTTATGVEYTQGGKLIKVAARREVIVSCGSIMSPALLKRSGVGNKEELNDLGIDIVHHSPEVGENLMDHLEVYVQQACTQPVTLFDSMGLWSKAMIGLRWLIMRDGLGATNHFESGAHIRSRAGICYPDLQFHFLPIAMSYDGKTLAEGHGFQVHVGTKRSKSRGWVRLDKQNPENAPQVQFNYMSHEDDWQEMRACIRLSREIFAQPAFDTYRGKELAPGSDCVSDEAIDEFIKAKVESAYHPCGTCRMGDDSGAVVDSECKVNGLNNLRVVDASIFPQATAGDLNAPTIMTAERAADIILGNKLLHASDAPIMIDPQWKVAQRTAEISFDVSKSETLPQSLFD